MWLFRHKYLADGMLSRYKARLVVNGSTQLEEVDVDETFSPVVKPGTIRTVLSLAASRHWLIHQLDVKNAFLHGLSMGLNRPLELGFSGLHLILLRLLDRYIWSLNLDKAHMANCNPSRTSIYTESKLGSDGDSVSDPTLYQSLAGSLQYLTFTRPDISYAVQQVCLHMHDPRERYFSALKRILWYDHGTLDYGLQLLSSSTIDLVAYSDADCAEAEYRGVANAIAETCWLRNLRHELHAPLSSATLVYCDNISTVYLSCNPVQHQRTKHIEIDIHFVRDLVVTGQVRVLHVPSHYHVALPSALFEEFRSSLSVRCPPAPTAGECLVEAWPQLNNIMEPYVAANGVSGPVEITGKKDHQRYVSGDLVIIPHNERYLPRVGTDEPL
ncbi:ribonuclease H-like domain-containing protein [Tanacetum coccineum]